MADVDKGYLGDRELASKVHLPGGPTLLKRGSDLEPLSVEEMRMAVDEDFLRIRGEERRLNDVRDRLSDTQATVWKCFLPQKYCEFLYATNYEGEGKTIDRIFYDIDRGSGVSAKQALVATRAFVEFLETDPIAQDITETMVISFTSNSF